MAAPPARTYQFTFVAPSSRNRGWTNVLLIGVGAALAAAYAAYRRRKSRAAGSRQAALGEVGIEGMETRAAVDRLLQAAFGPPDDVLPYATGPKDALQFSQQVALLAERHCAALRDFTGELGEAVALDVGCGVGGVSFELARAFPNVLALDASKACINAAKTLKERGWMRYTAVQEGELTAERVAAVPEDVDRARLVFMQADPLALPRSLPAPFEAVVAANLLCRLRDPAAFLRRLPALVRHGGVAVLASPHDWREGCTPRAAWVGGYRDQKGAEVWTADALRAALDPDFELVAQQDVPFLVREHARRFLYGVSHVTVWRRR